MELYLRRQREWHPSIKRIVFILCKENLVWLRSNRLRIESGVGRQVVVDQIARVFNTEDSEYWFFEHLREN